MKVAFTTLGCRTNQHDTAEMQLILEKEGFSIVNPSENADIYVAGHHHNWSLIQEELQDGRVIWMGRARGYKYIDVYAKVHGFRNHEDGATILFVIDPKADKPTTRIQAFADLEEGMEWLKWKRRNL